MFNSILTGTFNMEVEMICIAAALIYGLVISFTYMKIGDYSKNFVTTLVILPVVISVVVTLVNGSLGTSVAILGAFSLVRFRSMQGSSRDISFIFFAMASGLVSSMGYIAFGLLFVILVCLVYIILNVVHYGVNKKVIKELRITIPENLDYNTIFDDLFKKYLSSCSLVRVKTSNMGSMYELFYDILIIDTLKEKEMIDEIRCRNGNLTVICGRSETNFRELL